MKLVRFSRGSPLAIAIAVATLYCLGPPAQAAVIVGYDFNGGSAAPTTVDANADAGNFLAGAGLTNVVFEAGGGGVSARGWNPSADFDEAIAADDFFEFTVTADPGFTLTLQSLSLDNIRGSSGPIEFAIGIFDGVTTTLASAVFSTDDVLTNRTVNFVPVLTGLTSAVIRIAAWDAGNNGVNGTWRVDTVRLNGEVVTAAPVPEPASLALLALGGIGLAATRLRRRAT